MTEAYTLDTVALVLISKAQPRKLGDNALAVYERFKRGEVTLYVPAVSLMELWFGEKRTHSFPASITSWWARARDAGYVGIPLEPEDVVAARDLAWDHPDPHDRLIVATALRLGAPLVTSDRRIREWGGVETVW